MARAKKSSNVTKEEGIDKKSKGVPRKRSAKVVKMARAKKSSNVTKEEGIDKKSKGVPRKRSAKVVKDENSSNEALEHSSGVNPIATVVKKQAKSKGSKSKKRKQVEQSKEEEVDTEPLSCEKPVTIGKDDFISQLPAHCLNAVFILLPQDALDVLATVSQTFNASATSVRSRAGKRRCYNFSVSQFSSVQVNAAVVTIDPQNEDHLLAYSMCINTCFGRGSKQLPKRFAQPESLPKNSRNFVDKCAVKFGNIKPCLSLIKDHLAITLQKFMFSFENFSFGSVCFDSNFIDIFKNNRSEHMASIKFESCIFDKELGAEEKRRFVNEIIEAKPRTLMIDFPRKDDAEFFGKEFVLKYAETVEHPELTLNIRFHFDREYIRPISVSRDMIPILCRFQYLNTKSILIEPTYLIDMILDRLTAMDRENAEWNIAISPIFTEQMFARIDRTQYAVDFVDRTQTRDQYGYIKTTQRIARFRICDSFLSEPPRVTVNFLLINN